MSETDHLEIADRVKQQYREAWHLPGDCPVDNEPYGCVFCVQDPEDLAAHRADEDAGTRVAVAYLGVVGLL